jgi:molybdate transport system substrate-binding protein
MKSLFLLLLLYITLFANSINVAVAANVSYAIDELKQTFLKMHPNTKINITLGSSGKLSAQIQHGAPYDIFMSADMTYPNTLFSKGFTTQKPVLYTQGTLALFSTKRLNIQKNITLLEQKKIHKIAIANPKTAPYGKATIQALANANLLTKVKSKLIYAESISQSVAYTITAADIGIIATSALYSSRMSRYKKGINWIEIDQSLYTPIQQGIVLLNSNPEAKAFYEFIVSNQAKAIFAKYGYI